MRGRYPAGLEYIDKLEGSEESKERLKAILDTLYGEMRLLEACAKLGIGETRIHQLREMVLQAALKAIEPRPAGRPSRASSQTEQMQALEQQVQDLELALHEAQVRAEIALILPQHRRTTDEGGTDLAAEKKMPPERVKIRKPR